MFYKPDRSDHLVFGVGHQTSLILVVDSSYAHDEPGVGGSAGWRSQLSKVF